MDEHIYIQLMMSDQEMAIVFFQIKEKLIYLFSFILDQYNYVKDNGFINYIKETLINFKDDLAYKDFMRKNPGIDYVINIYNFVDLDRLYLLKIDYYALNICIRLSSIIDSSRIPFIEYVNKHYTFFYAPRIDPENSLFFRQQGITMDRTEELFSWGKLPIEIDQVQDQGDIKDKGTTFVKLTSKIDQLEEELIAKRKEREAKEKSILPPHVKAVLLILVTTAYIIRNFYL